MRNVIDKLKNSDIYRLKYHLMPVEGLLNDPNGLIEKDGIYHVFFQVNDKECSHGSKKWGHYQSRDLITWELKDFALEPKEWYETHGCYSGSAINIDNKIHLFYTGNVKNSHGDRETYQCLAIENPNGTFDKMGPVIDKVPEGYTEHFRDPKIFEKNNSYYMVLGAQNKNLKGEVLLYKSDNLKKWEFLKSIYSKEDLGYMIECPDLFELMNKRILLSSPQGIEPIGHLYNNLYQSGYMIEEGNTWSDFAEIDRGFDFYAPQTFSDAKGRRILYAWMGMDGGVHPTISSGNWIHSLTMPRELKLINNKIYQQPLKEMEKLRKNKINYKNLVVDKKLSIEVLKGSCYELNLEILNQNSTAFGLKLRKGKEHEIKLVFQGENLVLDRNKTLYLEGTRSCKIEGDNHKLQIFMDESSVEIFYNNGQEVFTSRVFLPKDSDNIEFFSLDGTIIIKNLDFYHLNSFEYTNV